jgi:hypothetical protein
MRRRTAPGVLAGFGMVVATLIAVAASRCTSSQAPEPPPPPPVTAASEGVPGGVVGEVAGGAVAGVLGELSETGHDTSAPVLWNAWFEQSRVSGQDRLRYEPVTNLPTQKPVLLGLHLSSRLYRRSGTIIGTRADRSFRTELERWSNTTEEKATVTAILVTDTQFFEGPGYIQLPLTIELDKLRSGIHATPSDADAFALLSQGDRSFVFAEQHFVLKTKNVRGRAGISVLIWDDENRPLEEFSGSICVGDQACAPGPPASAGRQQAGALAVSQPDSVPLDATIHIFRMQQGASTLMYGLLRTSEGKILWPLARGPESLRALLSGAQFEAFARAETDEQWLRQGTSLRQLLFPNREKRATDALNMLRRTIAARAAGRARVYIRMLDGDVAPVLFPLGAMTLDDVPLAIKADVVVPLRVQSYVRPTACLADWQVVAPPDAIGDEPLDAASKGAAQTLKTWRAHAKWPPPDSLEDFGRWLDGSDPLPTSVIFVLSHHDQSGLIRFSRSDVLTPTSASRTMTAPTVFILNACGGARVSDASLIDELNQQGVSTVVTTMTEVEAPLAADFTNCFNAELAAGGTSGRAIGDVFGRSIQCVASIKDGVASRHGLKALKYLLLGDGQVNICSPIQ